MASRWQDQAAGLRQLVAAPSRRCISFTGGRGEAGQRDLGRLRYALARQERGRLDEREDPDRDEEEEVRVPHEIVEHGPSPPSPVCGRTT